MKECKIGDLVHIPQAVELIDFDPRDESDNQLTIPVRVIQTSEPRVGVITKVEKNDGYVGVYCDGTHWSTRPESVYKLEERVK